MPQICLITTNNRDAWVFFFRLHSLLSVCVDKLKIIWINNFLGTLFIHCTFFVLHFLMLRRTISSFSLIFFFPGLTYATTQQYLEQYLHRKNSPDSLKTNSVLWDTRHLWNHKLLYKIRFEKRSFIQMRQNTSCLRNYCHKNFSFLLNC